MTPTIRLVCKARDLVERLTDPCLERDLRLSLNRVEPVEVWSRKLPSDAVLDVVHADLNLLVMGVRHG